MASSSSGIGFCGLLTVLFAGLKLANVGYFAQWSWWAVTSPLWISVSLQVAVVAGIIVWECLK
jgi:hypothetical protein